MSEVKVSSAVSDKDETQYVRPMFSSRTKTLPKFSKFSALALEILRADPHLYPVGRQVQQAESSLMADEADPSGTGGE